MLHMHPFQWLDGLSKRDPVIFAVIDFLIALGIGFAFSVGLAHLIAVTRLYP